MRLAVPFSILALAATALTAQEPARGTAAALTLLDALRIGRERGIGAVAARNTALAAAARTGQRRADLLPNIAGAASWTRQTLNLDEFGLSLPGTPPVTPDFNVYRLQLGVRQTLFDASVLARVRAARDNAVAAGLDARSAADLSGALAALAYLRVLGAEETVRARLQDSTVAASLLLQARRLVEAGVSPTIDRTRSEVSFAAVRTQLEVARNVLGRTRLDLVRALDVPADTALVLNDSLVAPLFDLPRSPDAASAFAREHRTEFAAERARTESQRRSLSAIRAENLPSISLGGQYTESGRQTSALRGTYNVTLGIAVPILDGLRRQERAREQEALLELQRTREHDVARQIDTEVREALLDLSSAQQQVAIAGERVGLADTELAQAQQRFETGVAGSVETTNAQTSVIAAHDALIQARLAYATARLAAYRALGLLDQLR
jgi:outer membrane protein TolC